MKKVVSAGSIVLDLTPEFPDIRVESLLGIMRPGTSTRVHGINVNTGGCVGNTGLAMKFFGADVRMMAKIGDDEFGRMILDVLKSRGYENTGDMIISGDSSTSYTIVLAPKGLDRLFLHDPGANAGFCFEDIDYDAVSQADHFHFGYPPAMPQIYADQGRDLVRIFEKVKSLGLSTSLDMSYISATSEAYNEDWKLILSKVIPYVDFFVPSIEELCFMLDKYRFLDWRERAEGRDVCTILDPEKDVRPLADELMEMGAKVLLLKCGSPGMFFASAGKEKLAGIGQKAGLDLNAWASRSWFEKSYKPDQVLSATGAGDTAISAFLVSMLEGYTPEQCVQFAAGAGASCCEAYDALSGLRSFSCMQEKIAAGWEKQTF